MAVANKAIAHADSWMDQVNVAMYLNQRGEYAGLATQHQQASVLKKEEHQELGQAIASLRDFLAHEIEALSAQCEAHANSLSEETRLAAPEAFITPPATALDDIKP